LAVKVRNTDDLADALTIAQFAELAHISERTVKQHIRDGKLGAVAAGRSYLIPRQDADAWISDRTGPRRPPKA